MGYLFNIYVQMKIKLFNRAPKEINSNTVCLFLTNSSNQVHIQIMNLRYGPLKVIWTLS